MSRIDTVSKKYPDQIDTALTIQDPSNGKNKYLLWIAKQLAKKHSPEDISATVSFFHEHNSRFEKKDINQYKDLKDLENIIKELEPSHRQKQKEIKEEGSKLIFEDENVKVIRVDNKNSMIIYGSNTRWCTTMKDSHYYEDYVSRGNNFYILITKKPILKSTKYAILRQGLFKFDVYDEKDSYAREFSDKEIEILHIPVQAIVADKAPKNYLLRIASGEFSANEIVEMIKDESDVTKNWVSKIRMDVACIDKTPQELLRIIISQYNKKDILSKLSKETISSLADELVVYLKDDISSNYWGVFDIIDFIPEEKLDLFINSKSVEIRKRVVAKYPVNKIGVFLKDKSPSVYKIAIAKCELDTALDFAKNAKTAKKRTIARDIVKDRLDNEKLIDHLLSLKKDRLKELLK
jgi:hypothetical protein